MIYILYLYVRKTFIFIRVNYFSSVLVSCSKQDKIKPLPPMVEEQFIKAS